MPAVRDFSQGYHVTTTFKHVEAPMPDIAAGDLLLAIISTDDSAAAAAQTVVGGIPVGHVFYNDDTGGTPAWTDYTVQANDATTGDWFMSPTVPTVDDTIYFGHSQQFNQVCILNSVAGAATTNTVWVLEYYNGSVWGTLTTTNDTVGANMEFVTTVHAQVVFTPPANWATVAVNGVTEYWIRWRCTTSNTFQTRPVSTQAWLVPVLSGNNGWRQLFAYYAGTTPAPLTVMWKISSGVEPDTTFFYSTAETADVELISIKDVQSSIDSGTAALTVNTNASGTYIRTTGSWVTDGFAVGMQIMPTGNTTAANNRVREILTITTTTIANDTITVTSATGMVTESGSGDERMIAWPFNSNVSGGGAGSTFDGYTTSNANSSRTSLPTLTTTKNDCLLIWAVAPDGANVPSIIEGACQVIAAKDGTAHSNGQAWGYQRTAGVTPTIFYTSTSALVTEMTVIAVNPPHSGATIRPGYGSADSSVYINAFAGAAFQSDSAPAATVTTPFTGTINGRPLVNGTFTALADTGLNSYHGTTKLTGVTTAKSWAGLRMTIASRSWTGKNILFHIQPLVPIDIQTTDSVSLTGACGVGIGLASSAGNFKVWHVGGSAVTGDFQRHQPVIINTGATAGLLQTTGTLVTTAIVDIGFIVSGKVVTPDWLIASAWLLDTYTVAGGIAAAPLDLAQIVKCYADGHERRSGIKQGANQALFLGPIQIGDGGTNGVYLSLDGTAIEFPRQYDKGRKEVYYNSTDNICGLKYYGGATDTIIHKNSVISSPSRYFWGLHASHSSSCTPNFSGLSVIGAGIISLANAVTITGLTINDYSTLDMTGLTFDQGIIKGVPITNDSLTSSTATLIKRSTIDVSLVTAGNRWCTVTTPVRFENNTFTGGGGHAIRITTAGTYAFVGNIFTGFGANTTPGAAILNDSGGLVTLNISGGGSVPSYKNGTSATTTINNNVTITLTGLNNPSEVRVFTAGTQTELAGTGAENVTTGSHAFSVASGLSIDINILSLGYQNMRILAYSTTSDTSIPISQVIDRQYNNPV